MLSVISNIFGVFKPWVIISILLVLMCGTGYFYYSSTQSTILKLNTQNTQLKSNNEQLIIANNANIKTINDLQNSYDQIQLDYQQSQSDFQNIRNQNKKILNSIMNSDINNLAYTDTSNTELAINLASKDNNRCLEILSGSPLTDIEKNAKTDKEFNSSCPWLFTPIIKH